MVNRVCLLLLVFLSGCIREGLIPCEGYIHIRIVDQATGEDITETGEAGEVSLFIFDEEQKYMSTLSVRQEDVITRTPVVLPYPAPSGYMIAGWANIRENEQFSGLTPGARPDEIRIELLSEIEPFVSPPDNLFFGSMQLEQVTSFPFHQEIVLFRKNARMHITARGFFESIDPEEFYFVVEMNHNGYTSDGQPIAKAADMRIEGTFQADGDFVTPSDLQLIHSSGPEDVVTVKLYRRNPAGSDLLLASATHDINGNPIAPAAGETTNVLLTLKGTSLEVHVIVTPWGETEQWLEW